MVSEFQRKKKQGTGMILLLLIIGVSIGLPIGYYIGAANPTDDYLTMVFSSEKKGWIEDLVGEFKTWYYQTTNRTISVNFRSMGSREMVIALQTGEIKPVLWSPASNLQVSLLDSLIPGIVNISDMISIIYSPTVIGTWNNTPYANITGFEDLRQYAILPGDLRFAHTDPRLSNSGYTSMMMQVAAYFNYTTGAYYNASRLTVENLTDEHQIDDGLEAWLSGIEKEADYYGKSTGYLAEKAKTDYQVFYVYENIIIDLNNDPSLSKQAIAIYPKEGLFLNNHPFCILDGDWVSSHDKEVARRYLEFMSLDSSVAHAFQRGFRPIDTSILGNSTYNETFNKYFNVDHGVLYDPPELIHGVPQDPLVLDYVTDVWIQVRAD
ncbi:MAG: hypothetical protein ACTSQI_05725 [Candidatus Helarchaeota archaeon]